MPPACREWRPLPVLYGTVSTVRLVMLGFVFRRLVVSILVLFAASFLVFAMVANASDPLGNLRSRNPPPVPEVIQARRHLLLLDRPVLERYSIWLTRFLH